MRNIVTLKRCGKCGLEKPTTDFYKSKDRYDGLCAICKKCNNEKGKNYYERNKDSVLSRQKEYADQNRKTIQEKARIKYAENPEKFKEFTRKWTEKNKEHVTQKQKEWTENNLERVRKNIAEWSRENKDKRAFSAEKRRASKASNGGSVTKKEWNDLLKKYDYTCLRCGKKDVPLTMDHVIPLSKGGRHEIENIQPLCGSCNSAKHVQIVDYRNN